MFKLKRAKKSDRIMKALTGMTIAEFEALVITFTLVFQKYQATRKPNRKRAVGGGRSHTLKTAAERLFFILFYLKCYPTMDVAGFFFGVDKSRIQRWVKELLPLLEETLGREVVLPARKINSVEEFMAQFPTVTDVFIDATERPVRRPQKNKAQRAHYSGRKRGHTKKTLVAGDDQGQILLLPLTKPGRRSDYFRFKQSGIGDILPSEVAAWVDLGFVGIEKDYPHLEVVIPHKKPKNGALTLAQRQENKLISQLRIRIEHTISRLKRFRAVADIFRNHNSQWADKFILLAAGLSNYHLRLA
jgi:hypothetical protein